MKLYIFCLCLLGIGGVGCGPKDQGADDTKPPDAGGQEMRPEVLCLFEANRRPNRDGLSTEVVFETFLRHSHRCQLRLEDVEAYLRRTR